MKIAYHPETDSLYIDLSEKSSVETAETSEGVNVDYDETGSIVGIDIDGASRRLDLRSITLADFPKTTQIFQKVA